MDQTANDINTWPVYCYQSKELGHTKNGGLVTMFVKVMYV